MSSRPPRGQRANRHVRRRSLYVDATTRPVLSTVAALVLTGALLARRRSR